MEEEKRELLDSNYKVEKISCTQGNSLIRAFKDPLTVFESKLLRFVIAQITKDDTQLYNYTISLQKLSKVINIPQTHLYEDVRELSSDIVKKGVFFETGEKDRKGNPKYRVFPWISRIEYDDGEITIGLNEALINYLLFLKESFTNYPLEEVLMLPTDNAIRMYELLQSWKRKPYVQSPEFQSFGVKLKKNQIILGIDYLRKYFNCDSKYAKNNDFVRRVVETNITVIKEKLLFPVTYEPVTGSRGEIVAIIFTLGRQGD